MKIRGVEANGRKRAFEVRTAKTTFVFPFSKADPTPSGADPVVEVAPDPELGNEGFTYRLRSGREGSIHLDSVLEVNEEPQYMVDLLMYELSRTAKTKLEQSGLTAREVATELGTSPAQLYRLLDPTNYTKSFRQLVILLSLLGCDVSVQVSRRPSSRRAGARAATSKRRTATTTTRTAAPQRSVKRAAVGGARAQTEAVVHKSRSRKNQRPRVA
jgi:hypothetical protein